MPLIDQPEPLVPYQVSDYLNPAPDKFFLNQKFLNLQVQPAQGRVHPCSLFHW